MNLEYDADETELLRQAGEVLERLAPVPSTGKQARADIWPALVAAGWSHVGAAVEGGELALSVAVDLFRRAGRQLLVEQFVTSAFILSALSAMVTEDNAQRGLRERLRRAPGVLLGDGRHHFVPVVTELADAGFCFGAVDAADVYRLVTRAGCYVLQRWDGPPPPVSAPADLSPAIRSLTLDTTAGSWLDHGLDVSAERVERLAIEAEVLHSAALIGCGERLLDITCDHVRTRVQFGVPIGSFQAVKHGLADVFTGLVVAWNATLSAVADGADEVLAPLVARVLAVDAALASARAGAQFHGGMGFTSEANVHLFLKTILDGVQRGAPPDDVACELARRFAEATC